MRVDGRGYERRRIPRLSDKLHPGQLAQELGQMLPPGAILLADGAHLAWLGYCVEPQEGQNFRKDAFRTALVSGRPALIDARITRWAVPHYSPSPHGVIAGLAEMLEERFRGE